MFLVWIRYASGMFKFFKNQNKKQYKPLSEYGDEWNVSESVYDGEPLIVRIRSSLKDAIGHPEYPFQIGVAIPCNNQMPQGMMGLGSDEIQVLHEIEDAIEDAIDGAVLVASITTKKMRELVLYTNDWQPEKLEKIIHSINERFPSYDFQGMIQQDPEWQTFQNLL